MDEPSKSASGRPAFGMLLRRLRREAGLSQEALADRAQTSVKTISALESGARRAPYRETVAHLADALQLIPEARTLLAAAASRPPRPRLAVVAPSRSAWLNQRHNLPEEASDLVGRDDVLFEVGALVCGHRLVTLVGSGGIGKTRIALRVGRNAIAAWPDGLWLVEFAPLRDRARVAEAIAQAVRLSSSPSGSVLGSLVDHLKDRRTLLVFDNCEHLIEDVGSAVIAILRDCENVKILATSRQPLGVAGERTYRVPSLSFPMNAPASVREASSYASVALFVERAQQADGLPLADKHVAAISEICRRLDGIPLAIELAAARTRLLTPSEIAHMLDERFRILSGDSRSASLRQRTMRSALDWSYALLADRERLLFDRLAVFAGGFSIELAGQVCVGDEIQRADVLDLLTSLVDKSLVVVDWTDEPSRFRLLESTRDYAIERLAERGDVGVFARRHAESLLKVAERLGQSNPRGVVSDRESLAEARREQANWRAALTWSLLDGHDVHVGQRLVAVIARPSFLYGGQESWLRAALSACDENTPLDLVASLELNMAYQKLYKWEEMLASSERAIAIYSDHPVPNRLAEALAMAALAYANLSRVSDAEKAIDQALALARRTENVDDLTSVLTRVLWVRSVNGGDIADARSVFDEGIRLFNETGSEPTYGLASLYNNMAAFERAAGDGDAAARQRSTAVAILRELGHPRLPAVIAALADDLIALGRYQDARQFAHESVTLSLEGDDEAICLYALTQAAAVGALRPLDDHTAMREKAIRAARLLGFTDSRLVALGKGRVSWPGDRKQRDLVLTSLHERLGSEKAAELMIGGGAIREDRAVELALSL